MDGRPVGLAKPGFRHLHMRRHARAAVAPTAINAVFIRQCSECDSVEMPHTRHGLYASPPGQDAAFKASNISQGIMFESGRTHTHTQEITDKTTG